MTSGRLGEKLRSVLVRAGMAVFCVTLLSIVGARADEAKDCTSNSGRPAYERHCASCHGDQLDGGRGPPLRGADFLSHWRESSTRQLVQKVRMTMPADRPGTLAAPQVIAIVAYLLAENGRSDLCASLSTSPGLERPFANTDPAAAPEASHTAAAQN